MIRHIVVFRLQADTAEQRLADAAGIRERLEGLRDLIPEVLRIEVRSDLGLVATHWDVVLIADYPTNEALEAYQSHPAHVDAVAWINTVVADRAVLDFDTD